MRLIRIVTTKGGATLWFDGVSCTGVRRLMSLVGSVNAEPIHDIPPDGSVCERVHVAGTFGTVFLRRKANASILSVGRMKYRVREAKSFRFS